MSDFTFPCEFCEQPITVPEERIGNDVACTHCGRTVTVPRPKADLRLKGRRRSAAKGAAAVAKDENLSTLTETAAFGGERAVFKAHQRRVASVRQTLVGAGLLVSIVVVGYGVWRIYSRQQERKHQARQAEEARQQQVERRRGYWREITGMNRVARLKSPGWALRDEDGYVLWLVLNSQSDQPRVARERFEAWVAADAALLGLCSERFQKLSKAAEIEPACQTLAGAALGLHGEGAALGIVAEFRDVARAKLAMEAAGETRHPD